MSINNYDPFALPSGGDYDVKRFTKQVKTLKWAKSMSRHLSGCAERLTTSGNDSAWTIGGMLQTGFGCNIGLQIDDKLTEKDYIKIKDNILRAVYNY